MGEQLDYAPPGPRYRRVGFVALVTIPVLIASYALALPKFRTFRDHEARRADVRRQFACELANARKAMDAGNLSGAAVALFNAEFPTRVERHLFSRFAVADLDRQLAGLRPRVDQAAAEQRREEEVQRHQAAISRRQQEEFERRTEVTETRCYLYDGRDNRQRVVDALHDRAAAVLQAGKNQSALAICQQILVLDPGHKFDAEFWANVQPKP